MAETPKSILEQQRSQYVEDMSALQANLEKQPGILGSVFSAIGQFFTGFLPHVGKAITGAIPAAWKAVVDTVNADVQSHVDANIKELDGLAEAWNMSPEMRDYLVAMLRQHGYAGDISFVVIFLFLQLTVFKGFMQTFVDDVDQGTRMRIRNSLPDPVSAIRAMFIDPSKEKEVRAILQRYGFNDERTDMMIAASRNLLDAGTLRDLYWRRELDDAGLYQRMRALGFTDERTAELVKTWNIIPGPQDLIRMAVREAFSPGQVAELGLDEAFPEELSEWAAKTGLKDPWPKMYWRAHWELPSAQMGFEMLHRGVIDERTLEALLRALDYSPRWHDSLKRIAYNVVTRVDARRLYSAGVYDERELERAYLDMGYSPEDAASLTDWTKIEYAQGDKELTRAQIERAYTQHIVDRGEAERMIRELGYSTERTGWILDMAEFAAASEERTQAIQATKDMYVAGLMTDTVARDRLLREEVDPNYVETLLMRWDATIATKRKQPTKSDLDKFLKAGLIGEAEYRRELERLGYSSDMVDRYYRLNTQSKEG